MIFLKSLWHIELWLTCYWKKLMLCIQSETHSKCHKTKKTTVE